LKGFGKKLGGNEAVPEAELRQHRAGETSRKSLLIPPCSTIGEFDQKLAVHGNEMHGREQLYREIIQLRRVKKDNLPLYSYR
jgi:hypothetical protein